MIKFLAGTVALSFGALGFAASTPGGSLRPGDFATPVKRLQQELLRLGFAPGLVNGYYGSETQAAVWAFQKSQGLVPRDRVGRRTWRALAHPRVPAPLVPGGEPRRVEIDLERQLLTVYRGRHRALVSHVSPGAGPAFCRNGLSSAEEAPTGDFQVAERLPRPGVDPLAPIYETFSFAASGPGGGGPAPGGGPEAGPSGGRPEAGADRDRHEVRPSGGGSEVRPVRRMREVPLPDGTPRPRPTVRRSYPINTVAPVRPAPTVKPVYPMATVKPIRPVPTAGPFHLRPPAEPPVGPPVGPIDIGPISRAPAVRPVLPEVRAQASPEPAASAVRGCVRVPTHVAERLFGLVEPGDPVYVRRG
ncbi:L,D-transpeptidase family protein [Streptosporangium jomthongense]|uniref:Peptidoglycan-binding protein n=1 Tax=Streptosporangium jomthongense TaxID=1193683 RepID=A0ABV8FC99_9ACTN